MQLISRGDPAEQHSAGVWLYSLLDQPQAALIALQLLTNGQEADVQFFAANMVLTVVKRHWSKIDMQSRDTIDGQIRYSAAFHNSKWYLSSGMSPRCLQRKLLTLLKAPKSMSALKYLIAVAEEAFQIE